MRKATLRNDFHGTSVNVMLEESIVSACTYENTTPWFELYLRSMDGDTASRRKMNKISRALCGVDGCTCRPVDSWEVLS